MKADTIILIVFSIVSTTVLRGSLDDILAPLPVIPQAKPVFVSPTPASESTASIEEVVQEADESVIDREFQIESEILDTEIVETTADPISQADLLRSIEDAVQAHFRPSNRVSLDPLRSLPDLSSYSQPFNVQVSRLPGRLSRNTMFLGFRVENETGVIGKWEVPFRPHRFNEVWYTKSYLRKGELATASDFEARQVDLLIEPNAVEATHEALQRHEYSRDVRLGQPLEWNDLAERSLVRKGQVVDVIAYQGMIGITMRAKAQQDGIRGDVVFLRNIESSKEFTGTVIDEGRVEVTF